MSNITTKVTLDAVTRKKDRSVSLRFTTQLEQSSDELIGMDELMGSNGVLYFKDSGNLTKEEVKELDNVEIEVEGKTKSQRLRNVLYVYYQTKDCSKQGVVFKSFNEFYADEMERIIQHYKDKLEP